MSEDPNPAKPGAIDRRQMLWNGTRIAAAGIVGTVGGIAGDAILGHPIRNGFTWMWKTFQYYSDPAVGTFESISDPADKQKLQLIARLFGDRGETLKFVGGRDNYKYPGGGIHPDDLWAQQVTLNRARQLAFAYEEVNVKCDASRIGSFVCTGSPVSNSVVRSLLEYDFIDAERPKMGFVRNPVPRLKLPFEFVLDPVEIAEASPRTIHEGAPGKLGANWAIRTLNEQILVPDTERRESDYLVISRVPNWLEDPRKPFADYASTATILAGTHGVGTAAVRLLFDNLELLEKLEQTSSEWEFWQVLIRVNGMRDQTHPISKSRRLVATSLSNEIERGQVTPF